MERRCEYRRAIISTASARVEGIDDAISSGRSCAHPWLPGPCASKEYVVNATGRSASWRRSMVALVLAAGVALASQARADRGRGQNEDDDEGNGHHGVCSLLPSGCRAKDCRCGD